MEKCFNSTSILYYTLVCVNNVLKANERGVSEDLSATRVIISGPSFELMIKHIKYKDK